MFRLRGVDNNQFRGEFYRKLCDQFPQTDLRLGLYEETVFRFNSNRFDVGT